MPEAIVRPPSGLYPKVLGDSWCSLDEALRRLHAAGATVRAAGVFRVLHGTNTVARSLARLARLPAAGEAVDVQLVVSALEHGEEWRRTFAGRPLVSMQYQQADGLMERMGIVALRFQLAVSDGALHYQTTRAALCLARLRIPLPRWLSPRVTAWERAERAQIRVSVEVHLPLVGRLIAYEGQLTQVEEPG